MLSWLLAAHPANSTGYRFGVTSQGGPTYVFRLPALAYIAVLFLLFGCAPLAFTVHGIEGEDVAVGPQTLVLVIPVLAAVFIARWATLVDRTGITIRAAFGRRVLPWTQIQGLSVRDERDIYAVTADGSWRLPCVHVKHLGALSRASGGHLPPIEDPTPKFAPQRRRRR
jgi:hypothetical protein